jgi:hypothetical protein
VEQDYPPIDPVKTPYRYYLQQLAKTDAECRKICVQPDGTTVIPKGKKVLFLQNIFGTSEPNKYRSEWAEVNYYNWDQGSIYQLVDDDAELPQPFSEVFLPKEREHLVLNTYKGYQYKLRITPPAGINIRENLEYLFTRKIHAGTVDAIYLPGNWIYDFEIGSPRGIKELGPNECAPVIPTTPIAHKILTSM